MAVSAHLALDVKVVEQDELTRKLVVVRRDLFREQTKRGIAIAFGHIAEHLVVSAVFFDDVKAILDGGGFARAQRNGVVSLAIGHTGEWRGHALVGGGGPALQLCLEALATLQCNDTERAAKQAAYVFSKAGRGVVARLRTVAIGF